MEVCGGPTSAAGGSDEVSPSLSPGPSGDLAIPSSWSPSSGGGIGILAMVGAGDEPDPMPASISQRGAAQVFADGGPIGEQGDPVGLIRAEFLVGQEPDAVAEVEQSPDAGEE